MLKTSEFVSPMHPDKMCDRISDAILDAYLKEDGGSRCAIEVMGGHELIQIMGEVTSTAKPDIREIVRRIAGNLECNIHIVTQSPEIAKGVDEGGAGDQGIMIGYACNENEALIPHELYLAKSLCKFLYEKSPQDGKTQITLRDGELSTIIASWANTDKQSLRELIHEWLSIQIDEGNLPNEKHGIFPDIYANPAGDWNTSGFAADTGLTGRKIIMDAYGTRVPVGGGAFSGKDATKVDRSGAYKARSLAVRLLKERNANEVFVTLAYAIGQPYPVQATATIDGAEIILDESWNEFTPQGIIKEFELDQPIYEQTAEWGHFGNGFRWDS
ncbi:methionine adenosyltransferase domain-containing protein [Candidatus Peregrinibacteria bacterium]|nr:MAG: methionine adenosyltransferase domain-containing protein [Candidatus Peregrinibacteria bacterium]